MKDEVSITAFTHLNKTLKKLEKPLPIPFDLPYNYPPVVMSDLAKNRLSGKARTKFISSVASAIFKYKNYPTDDEYNHIGSQIIKKFPFVKASSGSGGSGHVSIEDVYPRSIYNICWASPTHHDSVLFSCIHATL